MTRKEKNKNAKPWNLKLADIKNTCDCDASHWDKKWRDAKSCQEDRTRHHQLFSKIAHGQSLYAGGSKKQFQFSDGSTQAIKRKIRAQTIQRVPDGEIITQYDKNSIEQAIIDYLFEHKVLTSEFDGKDMMKNLWKSFNMSYDYGFACVRTGFEDDLDGDPRITFKLIHWYDVMPSADCDFIEEADWYFIREYMPISSLKSLIDWDTGKVKDKTYVEDVVKYLVENEIEDGMEPESAKLADRQKGHIPTKVVEIRTFYKRGEDEFITYVPSIDCILRKVKNYDPRKDIPLHFLILEPDPEFPLGCSSVMWTMATQQYADAFQSTAYKTLLLALNPPLQVFGNITNPKIKMKPNAIWPMGTNQNNKIEPYRVETTTLTQYGSISENISAKMMQSMNITDATVASDANVSNYSATPQGVQEQHLDKTITINQFQKRVEIFFQEWANHALRSYINSMTGEHELTVDEKTRRRIWDIENAQASDDPMAEVDTIVEGNKITVDFDELSTDLLSFEVRAGSLIENEHEMERKNIQEMLVPVSQMMGNIGDNNRDAFESIIMRLVSRLCELSDIDIAMTASNEINQKLIMAAMQQTMEAVMGQQGQINQMQQAMGMPQGQPPMPQEQPMPAQQPMPLQQPAPPEQGMPPEGMPPEGMPPEGIPPVPPEQMPSEQPQLPPEAPQEAPAEEIPM